MAMSANDTERFHNALHEGIGNFSATDVERLVDVLGYHRAAEIVLPREIVRDRFDRPIDAADYWAEYGPTHVPSNRDMMGNIIPEAAPARRRWTLWETMEGAAALTAGFMGARALMRR